MTELLTQALEQASKLPDQLQDDLAQQILEDIESESQWQQTLSEPQTELEALAAKALEDSEAGRTKQVGFDEL